MTAKSTQRTAAFRARKALDGKRPTMVFLPDTIQEQVAAAVKAGRFKSKQHLVEAAVCALIHQEQTSRS
jgi:Arc/MetJ-type ribon-helix-helix transcriptional regulator